MEKNELDDQEEFRPANDTRKRAPVETRKANTMTPTEKKPSLGKRWSNLRPTKMILFWACLASVILTMVVGFNWGGWVSADGAQKAAETMAKNAVVERLIPICVAQFEQDPDKTLKLSELNEMTSSQQTQFVRDQGWATISGEKNSDRKVADACAKLLLEMNQ